MFLSVYLLIFISVYGILRGFLLIIEISERINSAFMTKKSWPKLIILARSFNSLTGIEPRLAKSWSNTIVADDKSSANLLQILSKSCSNLVQWPITENVVWINNIGQLEIIGVMFYGFITTVVTTTNISISPACSFLLRCADMFYVSVTKSIHHRGGKVFLTLIWTWEWEWPPWGKDEWRWLYFTVHGIYVYGAHERHTNGATEHGFMVLNEVKTIIPMTTWMTASYQEAPYNIYMKTAASFYPLFFEIKKILV